MYGFKECSSCGALYNREQCCSNVSSVENFVCDPDPISYDETPDSSQQPPHNCFKGGVEKSFINDSNPNSFNAFQNLSDYPPQPSTRRILSEGISDDKCDVPFCDNSPPLDILNDHFEIFYDFNDDCTSSDDDSFENIDYVEASPLDSKLVSLEEVKDDILREKLLNINLFIAKIESLNDNPTPDCVLKSPSPFPIPVEDSDSFFEKSDTSLSYSNNSLPEFKTFSDYTEETRSGSTTIHADNSLPEYDSFHFKIEPDQGELTSVVMEDILGEPRVHVLNVLPTHPTLMLVLNFIPSDDSLGSDLEIYFPSGIRNKIFDLGIFFEVQSKRFLSRDTFSISFIRNPLCPVIKTLLPSENEDQVFNPGILSSNLLSHLGKITSDFSKSPMMISGGDIPFLDVLIAPDYEDSRAREIPSSEIKVHIEVLSVLWGNRLLIPDGSLPLSSLLHLAGSLDFEGSKAWKSKYKELFTIEYPYVQKIVDSYMLPLDELMKIVPDVLNVEKTGPSALATSTSQIDSCNTPKIR
ncbi:hypothetical protein Tco_1217485 [Tanacetum coccineum]